MIKRLTSRISYLPHEERGDRPVLGYVQGEQYSLMIDAGNSAAHVRLFTDALEEADLPLPDFCALTHWHWDHTFGMHALACPTIANKQTNAYLEGVSRWSWSDEAMAARLASGEDNEFCDREIRIEYPDRSQIKVCRSTISYENRLTLDLGGVSCELFRIENPHTADGVFIRIPEDGVLFFGDADCQGSHHGRRSLYKPKLAELIDIVEALEFTTCVPGHDVPCTKAELLEMLREALAEAE